MEGALIIDDDQLTCHALTKTLHAFYPRVKAVSKGSEALQEISSCAYHTCFLDIALPGVDGENGLHLLKRIRELSPDTLIVIMTGIHLDEEMKEKIEGSSFCMLAKPFEISELKAAARRAIGRTEGEQSEINRRVKRDALNKTIHYSITVLEMEKPISLSLTGDIVDMSRLGIGMRTSYPLEPGQLLIFTSGLEYLEHKAGIVRWSAITDDSYAYRVGIEFIETEGDI